MSDRTKKWGAMIHAPVGVVRNIRIAVEKTGDQRVSFFCWMHHEFLWYH